MPIHSNPSLDSAAGAIRQGDVHAAQIERPGQAFGPISDTPCFDARNLGKAAENDRVGRAFVVGSIDAGSLQRPDERRHILADDQAGAAGETPGEILGRRRERQLVVTARRFAHSAEPVAEPGIDSGDHQPVGRRRLGPQHRRRGDAGQGDAEADRQAPGGGQTHAYPGEAAGTGRDGDQVELAPCYTSLFQRGHDRGQESRRLVAPLLEEARQSDTIANDRDTLPTHGTIESQNGAHTRPPRQTLALMGAAGHCCVMKLDLVAITPPDFDVDVTLAYATEANLTGRPVYRNAECWLHREAADRLAAAIALARPLGLRLRIFDALRPVEAQWALWNVNPDPEFIADPRRGSPHSRGVAVDLNLLDSDGQELDMGTAFDAFTPLSHHGRTDISVEAQRNRLLLMGLMTAAGWDFYRNEWWHYQLFDARRYPLVADADLPRPMM